MIPRFRPAAAALLWLAVTVLAYAQAPIITTQPVNVAVLAGGTATFRVQATGSGLAYQWRKIDGGTLRGTGQTSSELTISTVATVDVGQYTVTVSNSQGSATSRMALLTIAPPEEAARLVNLSLRSNVGTGDDVLIVGFNIVGATAKPLLLRGIGPSLGIFGVTGTLADPVMTLYRGQAAISSNDDWTPHSFQIGFALAAGSRDSVIASDGLAAGSYSVQVAGKANGTGIALAEVYDATPPASFGIQTSKITNLSARTRVGTGDRMLIAGITIGGATHAKLLIRAIGPTLRTFGVSEAIVATRLRILDAENKLVAEALGNWNFDAEISAPLVGAFPLPAGSLDSAIAGLFAPGSYTVQVSGLNGETGIGLIEVYLVP